MKVTFFSNFLNHHQLPFCLEMVKLLGDNFKFVATEDLYEEQKKLGYEDMNKKYPFVITTYDNEDGKKEATRLAIESDVIIHGSAPEIYIKERMKFNKFTFRYAERMFKTGRWHIISPRVWKNLLSNHLKYKNMNLYMLCASAYTAGDYALAGAYKGKVYKWGYFPEVKKYENVDTLIDQKKKNSILWAGRLIDWKHPEHVVEVAQRLKKEQYNFDINIIGRGDMQGKLEKMICKNDLQNYVHILGSMPPEEVRKYMEQASIYLFTSDFQEGWGAVLNESMNSACAIVASHAIGSVPFLLEDGKNGLIYKNGEFDDLYLKVKFLLDNPEKAKEFGKNAYCSLCEMWNSKEAAERFITLVEEIMKGKKYALESGPLSFAETKNHWIK